MIVKNRLAKMKHGISSLPWPEVPIDESRGCDECRTSEKSSLPRMDHIYAILERNPDDVVLCEVGCDRGKSSSDEVGFVGLPKSMLARGTEVTSEYRLALYRCALSLSSCE